MGARPKFVAVLIVVVVLALFAGIGRAAFEAEDNDGNHVLVLTQEEALKLNGILGAQREAIQKLMDENERLKGREASMGCV